MKKGILTAVGILCLVLGGLGIILPLLPTTPFVLVAAACFSGANPRLYRWLADSRYFGEYLRSYREKGGISKKTLFTSISFLWICLLISALIFPLPWLWAVMGIAGTCVTIHLLIMGKKRQPNPLPAKQANGSNG